MKRALILGASGRFGRHTEEALKTRGWQTRRFDRKTEDMQDAAQGMDAIIQGLNPQYPDWAKDYPRLTQEVIRAAKRSNALVVFPANFYNYGTESAPWSPKTAWKPINDMGEMRVQIEHEMRISGIRVFTLRCGDFIDTLPSGNWFDRVMIKSLKRGLLTYPGDCDAPHNWAYLPDVARALADLLESDGTHLSSREIVFPGYTLTARQMAHVLEKIRGHSIKAHPMSWRLVTLLRPVWPMAACLLKMRYLWDHPHSVDGADFHAALPGFKPTPIEEALARATS